MALEQPTSDPGYILNEVISRVRGLESKQTLMSERVLVINKNMIIEYKQLTQQLHIMNSELRDIKIEMLRVKEAMQDMIKETKQFARKDKLKLLEKYVDLWNPMRFVTEEDVKNIVRDEVGKRSVDQ
ncbi:MAG: hypothetical protein AABW49_03935 [Nanoarchaeota archaeon]